MNDFNNIVLTKRKVRLQKVYHFPLTIVEAKVFKTLTTISVKYFNLALTITFIVSFKFKCIKLYFCKII